MLTLPAHHECHADMEEEYFREYGVAHGAEHSDVAKNLYQGKVTRAAQRSEPLRRRLLESLVPEVDVFSDGGIWLRKAPAFKIDPDRFYRTPEKVVRGLFRHHTGRTLAPEAGLRWDIVNSEPVGSKLELFQMCRQGLQYPGVFDCRYGVPSDAPPSLTIWWMRFWNGLVMLCYAKDDAQVE